MADGGDTVSGSSAYEHVLIELDRIHGDESPSHGQFKSRLASKWLDGVTRRYRP